MKSSCCKPAVVALLACLVLLGTGCGLRNPAASLEPADERLTPDIRGDGSKFFTFERIYTATMPDQRRIDRSGRNAPRGPSPGAIEARLEQIMTMTDYCREGFFELYRERLRGTFTFRGECREAATEEDNARFGNGEPIVL